MASKLPTKSMPVKRGFSPESADTANTIFEKIGKKLAVTYDSHQFSAKTPEKMGLVLAKGRLFNTGTTITPGAAAHYASGYLPKTSAEPLQTFISGIKTAYADVGNSYETQALPGYAVRLHIAPLLPAILEEASSAEVFQREITSNFDDGGLKGEPAITIYEVSDDHLDARGFRGSDRLQAIQDKAEALFAKVSLGQVVYLEPATYGNTLI